MKYEEPKSQEHPHEIERETRVVPSATPFGTLRAPLNPSFVRECPKCGARQSVAASDCTTCGIVFSKYAPERSGEIRLEGDGELVKMWDGIMANYEDESRHGAFVNACAERGALAFASQRYSKILSAFASEETARKMRRRIIGLASYSLEPRGARLKPHFRAPLMIQLIFVLGGAALTTGLLLPGYRGVAGFGLLAILIAIGLKSFLNPRAD